jgi:Predicted transcriptional regulators
MPQQEGEANESSGGSGAAAALAIGASAVHSRLVFAPNDANPSPATLGARIQRIRLKQNLSVRDVADRASVNKNTILRLERGMTPSYATLTRVCEALGIHVAQLTRPEPDEEDTISLHHRDREVWYPYRALQQGREATAPPNSVIISAGGEGRPALAADEKVLLSVLASKLPGGRLNSAVLELYAESEPAMHPGEEFVFCLRGTAKLTVAGRSYTLKQGDAASFWCSERHSYAPADETPDEELPVTLLSVWIDAREERPGGEG